MSMAEPLIPYGRQTIEDCDVDAVTAVLRSGYLTQGPAVARFERGLAAACGGGVQAVAVNSATSALHLSAMALGLGPGDALWTVPNTFVATANCARYCGAEVDFVDIDQATYTIDVGALEGKLKVGAKCGRLPKVVAAVDFAGQPCDWDALIELKERYGFALIDDAAHAMGAKYKSRMIGGIAGVDATVFSFHPVKIIATAEGGAVVTDRQDIAQSVVTLRTHGITKAEDSFTGSADGAWYYEQQTLGYNYRITDLQAALGSSQLQRLDCFLDRRRQIAARYDVLLADLPVTRPFQSPDAQSAWHLYVIQVPTSKRRQIFDGLRQEGIGVQVHYIPVHLQPYYRTLGFRPGDFPVAEHYYAGAISLPIFPLLTEHEQDRVVGALASLLRQCQ